MPTSARLSRPHNECTRSLKLPWSSDWLKRWVNFTSQEPFPAICEEGRERYVSPRGMGVVGVYWLDWAATPVARRMQNAECRMQTRPSVIRRSSANPVPHKFDLRVREKRAALWHPIAGDAAADDLAVEI